VAVATVDIQVNSQGAVNSIRNVNTAATQLERQVNNTNRSVKQLETAFAGLGVAVAGMNALNIAKDFFATANAADAAQRRIKMVSTGLDDYRLVMQTARNASAKFGLSQTEAANAVADIYTRLRPVGFGLSEINAIYEGFNTAVKLSSVEAGAASAAFLQLSQGLGSGTLQGDELRSVLEQMPSIAQAIAKEMDINVGSIKKFGSEGKITADVIVRALDRIRTEGAGKLAEALNTPQQKIIDLQNAMETFKIVVASDVAPAVIGGIEQITEAVKRATQFVINLREGFRLLAKAFSGVGAGINSINTALSGTINKFAALGQSKGLMMMLNFLTLGGAGALASLAKAGEKSLAGKKTPTPKVPTRVDLSGLDLGGGAASKTGKTSGGAANKAANDAARLAEQTKTQLAAAFKMNALAAADLDIQVSMTKEEKLQGEFDKVALERRVKFLDLQKNAKSEAERQALASAQLSEILIANNKYAKDKKDLLEQQTAELYRQLDVSGILDKNLQKRLSGAFTGGAATGTFRTDIDLMPGLTGGKAGKKIEDLKTQIAELTNIGNIAITSAEGIGNAFANSFQGLIDGSMSAREALSGFFKDVASMFLEMASQIIAKQMTMIILQSILKALGAVAGAGNVGASATNFGGAPGVNFNPSAFSMPALAANGAYFSNGIAAFARGGIVGSPTLFQFANGGTTQTGLMGEAGPEAIMPLSRGAGGKLGVNASGLREAMGGAPGMGGSPVLNMSFETTRFGDTDYVSRDQLEAAMAQTRRQASSDGAKRGMSMTLDRLQQSPQTRSRVGLR
jgi:tape measure domain-containing protein